MGWKSFSTEEVEELRKNVYVKNVGIRKISFSTMFKKEFWERYEKGESPKGILKAMGLNTEALGDSRIRGIVNHIKEQAESGSGFTEGYNWQDKNKVAKADLPVAKRLLRIEHELAYTKQELEFIKKIMLAEREARQKCSSKREQMSSSE